MLRYLDDVREGTPIADLATVVPGRTARDAALVAMRELSGQLLSTSDDALAECLVIEGAAEKRHAFVMQCDLRAHPGNATTSLTGLSTWPTIDDPSQWAGILPLWRAAYPPAHPDHFPGDDKTAIAFLASVLSGQELGRMHDSSTLLVESDGTAVAGIIVTIRPQDRPYGGPWILDVWCCPELQGSGIGHQMISRAKYLLAADGQSSLHLAVTASNPARRLYDREGFRPILESRTLSLPKARV